MYIKRNKLSKRLKGLLFISFRPIDKPFVFIELPGHFGFNNKTGFTETSLVRCVKRNFHRATEKLNRFGVHPQN